MQKCLQFFLLMTMTCSSLTGLGQERVWDQQFVDSILPRLGSIKGDSNAVDQMRKLSEMYFSRHPDSAILFADRGDSIAETIGYYRGQILCLVGSAMANVVHSNWANATLKMNKAMPISHQHAPDLMLLMYNIMFAISGIKGEFEEATQWKNRQLGILDEYTGPDWVRWPTYMQLTIFYDRSGQLDSANYYADSLKAYLQKYGQMSAAIRRDSYMIMGTRALKTRDTAQALQFYHMAPFYLGLAKVYQAQGNKDSTIFYAEKELALWTKLKSPHNIIPPAEILASTLDSINPAESNRYLKIYVDALGSFFNTDRQLAQVRLNQERLENELQSRDAENRNKISMIVAAAIVILLGGFSFLLWRNNRFKQKTNQKLEASYKELKATQAQLIQSEKMASLGELTAGIAHEIQNPLNFVNNFSEVNTELLQEMKQGIKSGNYPEVNNIAENLEANMEKISHHGKRADSIVKSMLQHSRTSSGQKEPTDINSLVEEYFQLSYHGFRARDKSFNASMHTEFDDRIGTVNIIPQDIGRVLLNVFNNAFYAVTEKKAEKQEGFDPAVSVFTKRHRDHLEISISDNGNGIPQKIIDDIFQPFFTTKPSGHGTGLGLSLSYDIVKAHGGDIKVKSEEGKNTIFTIELPIN